MTGIYYEKNSTPLVTVILTDTFISHLLKLLNLVQLNKCTGHLILNYFKYNTLRKKYKLIKDNIEDKKIYELLMSMKKTKLIYLILVFRT